MNPQTQAEARRVLDVVDDLVADLECLACFPTSLAALPARDVEHIVRSFSGDGGREAQEQLREHLTVEPRLDRQVTRPGLVVANSTGEMVDDGPLNAEEIENLHLSTRALIDTLREARFGTAYTPTTPRSAPVSNFVSVLRALRGLLAARFETTVEEDVVKFNILNDTVNRADAASGEVSQLNRDLHHNKQSRKEEVEKRTVIIRRLEAEMNSAAANAVTSRENIERSAQERSAADHEAAVAQLEELKQQVEELERELATLEKRCWMDEQMQRQQRTKKEAALGQIIQAYDTEMFSLTDTLKQLRLQIVSDRDEYAKIDGQLQRLLQDSEIHAQEMALEEERKTQTATIAANRHVYSRVIQAFFRSHITRVRAAAKNKKKKKRRGSQSPSASAR